MTSTGKNQQRQLLEHYLLIEHCLISELHRLHIITPPEFFINENSKEKFSRLIVDFSYFENPQILDKPIKKDEELRLLDDEFTRKCRSFVTQFNKVLEELCNFITDFVDYTEKFRATENVMDPQFSEIYTLRCNALFLLGVILLVLDLKFPGLSKERIFVAHTRINGELQSKNFELAMSILRRRREPYETCFSSLGLNRDFVNNVINFLRSYTFSQNKDVLQDRFASTRQSAMIYTCLYFSPDILHNQLALMRQICDLYFVDNWILPIHVELTVNLFEKWDSYKAASSAISIMSSRMALEHAQTLASLRLPSGLLSIEKFNRYSSLILDYNRHLQWLILHCGEDNKKSKKSLAYLQEIQALTKIRDEDIFTCLLKLSRLEYKFKQSCIYLITNKEEESNRLRRRICNIFEQIAVLLSSTAIDQGDWNERLKSWVITLKDTVTDMPLNSSDAPLVLEHLRSKIDEVIELQADEQLVFKQYFQMVNSDLEKLKALCLVNDEFLKRINEQTDSTYLWSTLNLWTQKIESLLKDDALSVKFLLNKIAYSITNQLETVVNKNKREILSKFYHQKLEMALRKVIQAIPRAIFAELDQLQPLFSTDTACQIEKTNVKNLAQLERRRKLARKTYEITKLSLGISNMQMNHLGPIEIKPNELLFDGLKQELNIKLRSLLREPITDSNNYLRSLDSHRVKLKTFRDAFVFVCEHIGAINGVSLWQSELANVVSDTLEKERIRFEKTLILNDKRNQQPTQLLPHLIDVMLRQTDPKNNIYFPTSGEWFGMSSQKLEYSINLFLCIEEWLPSFALVDLQRLVGCVLTKQLRSVAKQLEKGNSIILRHYSSANETSAKSIENLTSTPEFMDLHSQIVQPLIKIGHYSILYEQLEHVILETAQSRIGTIHLSLSTFIEQMNNSNKDIHFDPKDQSKYANFLKLVAKSGLSSKIIEPIQLESYCKNTAGACLYASLIYYFNVNAVSNKKADALDHFVFVKGLTTALKEFDIWDDFERLFDLTLIDTSVFSLILKFRNLHILLPLNKIPEALQK